jgi:uncharacterized protein (DUF1697 family)
MTRYAAFLRGVMPTNARMSDLRDAFEVAGFTDVKTLLASGNVLFSAPRASEESLQRRAEKAMMKRLGRSFLTLVRPVDVLRELLASDPFGPFRLEPGTKRIVTFLRAAPERRIALPVEDGGARILILQGKEAFSAYVRDPSAANFMTLIEKTFGKDQTTRTWETVTKAAR